MKKYLLPVLTGVGLVAFMPANAKAQVGFSIYAEPGYYESGYRPDYSYCPDHRYYYYPPYYYYRPYYYHRWHRWHYHQHWRAND